MAREHKPLDREDRIRLGQKAHNKLSRNSLANLAAKKRGFDPIEILLSARAGRVPKLLPIKYQRMAVSPFAFFRGAVSIMAADLARQPNTGLTVQLCGDAHVQNLGSFEAPDGRLVFDINDFDETIAGPWEWDVKRMAASIVLAGMESGHNTTSASGAAEACASTYLATVRELAEEPILVAARHQIRRLKKAQAISAALRQAARAQPTDLLKKYTEHHGKNAIRFREIPSLLWRVSSSQRKEILNALPLYRESLPPERVGLFDFFRPLDVGFKIVGTGSVGLRDYVVLMEGNGPGDPLFLQIKQEVASAYAPYLTGPRLANQGCRVAQGQHRIQPISDLMLGWTRIGEHDFLVRQLNDHKGSVDLENLRGTGLNQLATIAGELLARGHARSGDALSIASYAGTGDKVARAIAAYGRQYADLTHADFDAFKQQIASGQLKVAA